MVVMFTVHSHLSFLSKRYIEQLIFGFNFLVEIAREKVAPKRPVYTFRVDR